LKTGRTPNAPAHAAHDLFGGAGDLTDLGVGEAMSLGQPQQLRRQGVRCRQVARHLVDQHHLIDEPRVDAGGLEDLIDRRTCTDRIHHDAEPAVVRHGRALELLGLVAGLCTPREGRSLAFKGSERLLQGLGEVTADRHRLADTLHVRGQHRVGGWKLLEREPRHLDHDVVERRLEARRGLSCVMSLGISSRE
jgi:hypothetical protein